jgi:hypothetical protein
VYYLLGRFRLAGWLLGLLFHPEDGSNMFIRNWITEGIFFVVTAVRNPNVPSYPKLLLNLEFPNA